MVYLAAMYSSALEALKKHMEGKTVVKVEPPQAPEAVCKFHMSDGSVFRLHATDLGSWVEETVRPDETYKSLDALFRDYGHHVYLSDNQTPNVELRAHSVALTAPDGRLFMAMHQDLSEADLKLISTRTADEFAFAAELGDAWKMALR